MQHLDVRHWHEPRFAAGHRNLDDSCGDAAVGELLERDALAGSDDAEVATASQAHRATRQQLVRGALAVRPAVAGGIDLPAREAIGDLGVRPEWGRLGIQIGRGWWRDSEKIQVVGVYLKKTNKTY